MGYQNQQTRIKIRQQKHTKPTGTRTRSCNFGRKVRIFASISRLFPTFSRSVTLPRCFKHPEASFSISIELWILDKKAKIPAENRRNPQPVKHLKSRNARLKHKTRNPRAKTGQTRKPCKPKAFTVL